MSTSITKKILWKYVNNKINHSIHSAHVFSVISILFEEIINELVEGKELRIVNFGVIRLVDMKPRKYHDVVQRCVMHSDGNKMFHIKLSPKLKKKLCTNLDLDKTFGDD